MDSTDNTILGSQGDSPVVVRDALTVTYDKSRPRPRSCGAVHVRFDIPPFLLHELIARLVVKL